MEKIFQDHPKLKVYYKTSDNTPFYTDNDAKLHAKTLENKNVEPVFRLVKEKVEKVVENISQNKIQKAVNKDVMSELKTAEEKEAEELAQKDAEALVQKEQKKTKSKTK